MIRGDARALGLVHFQSERFRRRLDSALAIVGQALRQSSRPYVAFSLGKDSCAVSALVHALAPEAELVWGDDELELPETVEFAARVKALAGDQFAILAGWSCHAGWFYPWRQRPFFREPLPEAEWTVRSEEDWMRWQKERGHDLVFLGLRGNENRRRRDWFLSVGPIYPAKSTCRWRCAPLWDWTEDDVWALIYGWKLAYNPAYDVMEAAGIHRRNQRVGPLPLAPRRHLEAAYPDLLARLEERYARRWSE